MPWYEELFSSYLGEFSSEVINKELFFISIFRYYNPLNIIFIYQGITLYEKKNDYCTLKYVNDYF